MSEQVSYNGYEKTIGYRISIGRQPDIDAATKAVEGAIQKAQSMCNSCPARNGIQSKESLVLFSCEGLTVVPNCKSIGTKLSSVLMSAQGAFPTKFPGGSLMDKDRQHVVKTIKCHARI